MKNSEEAVICCKNSEETVICLKNSEETAVRKQHEKFWTVEIDPCHSGRCQVNGDSYPDTGGKRKFAGREYYTTWLKQLSLINLKILYIT